MPTAALTLDDWLSRLESYSAAEIELGLDRVCAVLEKLPLALPDKVFLVGGTNGKGSSVAMLEAILAASGRRVGCYTSPHIHRYNERIRIAGQEADDAAIVGSFERIDAVLGGIPLTYFEFGTLAALLLIADAGIDVAILEVGMGGRLDAVNAVDADACLITNIALDHCEWLGDDIDSIAFEKAGIMRRDRPVVFAASDRPAPIDAHAAASGARLVAAGRDYRYRRDGDSWSYKGAALQLDGLPLPALAGDIQLQNAAGCLALLDAAGFGDCLEPGLLGRALQDVRLPGRMQLAGTDGSWLFDVAHNPAAAAVLADALAALPVTGGTTALIGMLADKDADGVIAALAPQVDRWLAVTADSPRALPAGELAGRIATVTGRPCRIVDDLPATLAGLERGRDPGGRILVTGSFFVVGPVLRQLELYSPRLGNS